MTKEEYLKNYKEDKLAEICESLENDCESYKKEVKNLLGSNARNLKDLNDTLNELYQMKEIFDSVDNIYERLKQMPVEDFLNLYHKMKSLVDCGMETKKNELWTTISNVVGTGTLTAI